MIIGLRKHTIRIPIARKEAHAICEGKIEGEDTLALLMKKLFDQNRIEDAKRASEDKEHCTRHTYASLCDRAGVNKDILKRAVGHTPKSKTLDEVYLHPKATQMIEAFDKANQLVKDEVLALPEK